MATSGVHHMEPHDYVVTILPSNIYAHSPEEAALEMIHLVQGGGIWEIECIDTEDKNTQGTLRVIVQVDLYDDSARMSPDWVAGKDVYGN